MLNFLITVEIFDKDRQMWEIYRLSAIGSIFFEFQGEST